MIRTGVLYEFDVDTFKEMLEVRTLGTWLCLEHEIGAMERQGRVATIFNIASNTGLHLSRPDTGAHAAWRAAVAVLPLTTALEAIGSGIRTHCVSPGPVDTPMCPVGPARTGRGATRGRPQVSSRAIEAARSSRPRARRTSVAPARSRGSRFWLSLALPTSEVTATSMPTMWRSMSSMNSGAESPIFQGTGSPAS